MKTRGDVSERLVERGALASFGVLGRGKWRDHLPYGYILDGAIRAVAFSGGREYVIDEWTTEKG